MSFQNNIYANAAFLGFVAGVLQQRGVTTLSSGAVDDLNDAAAAFATEVDSLIAFDAHVTTSSGTPTQLAITTDTIAANEQWRAGLLQAICQGAIAGRWPVSAVSADYDQTAVEVAALWTSSVAQLTTP